MPLSRLLTTTLTLTANGEVAPAQAWARYAEVDRWPEWSPQIDSVELDGPPDTRRRLAPGLHGTVRAAGGVGIGFEVGEVDEEAMTWSWQVRFGPIRMSLEHRVTALTDGRSSTELAVTGPTPAVLAYAPMAQVALQRLVSQEPG